MSAFAELKKFRGKIFFCCIVLAVAAFSSMFLPTIMSDIIDNGINVGNMDYILKNGLLMVVLAVISMISYLLSARLIAGIVVNFSKNLKFRIFRKINKLSFSQFSLIGPSALLSRTMEDVDLLSESVYFLLRVSITLPVMFIGGIVLSLSKDAVLSLIMLIFLPVMVVAVFLVGRKLFDLWNDADNQMDRLNQILRERLSGIRVIRAFNREPTEHNKLKNVVCDMTDRLVSANIRSGTLDPVSLLLLNLTTVAIIYFGGLRVQPGGAVSAASVFAVVQYVSMIMNSVMMLSIGILFLPRIRVKLMRINQVLKADTTEKVTYEKVPLGGNINFENVSFKYADSDEYVLENISIDIKDGQTIAFIGGTGSGKSSVLRLLLGFYQPTDGDILYDGISYKALNPASIRDNISCVLQRTAIFSESVAENILLGNADASREQILNAMDIAEIRSYVDSYPDGLDHKLEQGGANLSGGQKQRMVIARSILRDASIYIFDDCFSALDFLTESRLRAKLNAYIKGKTQIVCTQRIATAMSADKIYVFDKGRIVGEGKHSDLLINCEIYKEIYNSQVGGDLNG